MVVHYKIGTKINLLLTNLCICVWRESLNDFLSDPGIGIARFVIAGWLTIGDNVW